MPVRRVSLDSKNKLAKKASLAALMPDKTPTGLAARNRAVKRMYKTTVTRTKKADKPKVKAKTPKQPSPVKSATSPTPRSESQSRPNRVRASLKDSSIEIESRVKPVDLAVTLPDRVSVRSQEKVLAVLSSITKDFRRSAETVAYVSGFCFVIFGSYLSLSFSGNLPATLLPQAAQLMTSTETTRNTITDTVGKTALSIKPTFSLHDPLPPVIEAVSRHTIEVTDSNLVDASAYSLSTGEKVDITAESIVASTFRLTIDPSSLKPSRYVLKVTLESTSDNSKYIFKVGEFEINPPVTDASENTDETASSTDIVEPIEDLTGQEISNSNSANVSGEKFTITTLGTTLNGRTVIKVASEIGVRAVEIYIRPLKSSTKRFIGLAERHNGAWQYFFDTNNVPNGEYEIIARARIDGSYLEANTGKISIVNFTGSPTTPVNPTLEAVAEIVPAVEINPENARSFSEYSVYSALPESDFGESTTSLEFEQTSGIEEIIVIHRDSLEKVMERYAVAKQSENSLMLALVEKELQEVRNTIVNEVLLNPNLDSLGDDVDAALKDRFLDTKRRIDTFEELRRTATERGTSIDRDGDGISDFDEVNLYQTDPDKSDTDNDGVTDGIEIMSGFDPLNPLAEAVVTYEMPQDTIGLLEDDILKIDAVSPVINTNDPTLPPNVQAEIRGKGLPNSFVTIYIFSSPTIVTVRTSEDGSFVYTFEKELEDGEHEVYVAVTDNTGDIMARSNGFKFVKQAEAFSPVGGTTAPLTNTSLTGIQIFGTFNIAIGLGILAFGLILLMLGATLRERQGFIMTTPKNNVST